MADSRQTLLRKSAIADSFSRASGSYDQHAQVQREVGQGLLTAPVCYPNKVDRWLDVGCGTGFLSAQLLQHFGAAAGVQLDLSSAMVQQAAIQNPQALGVCADAECLPFASASVGLLFSNFVWQWGNVDYLAAEAARVLSGGGQLRLSLPVEGSFAEIRDAWQQVDGYSHVSSFATVASVIRALEKAGFNISQQQQLAYPLCFDSVSAISRSMKQLGATNLTSQRRTGLTGKNAFCGFKKAMQAYRNEAGKLEIYYQVLSIVADKQ